MAEPANFGPKAVELARRFLSHVAFENKLEDIERILNSPAERYLSSAESSLYCHFVTALLDNLSASSLKNAEEDFTFDAIVLRCSPDDLFLILASAFKRYSKSYKRDKVCALIDKFVQGDHLYQLLVRQCQNEATLRTDESSWSTLETIMVSLPERIANSRDQDVPSGLVANKYFVSLLDGILRTLHHARDKVNTGSDVHVTFLSRLLGRVCVVGQSELVARHLVPRLVQHCENDYVFRRVCSKVVTGAPDSCIENVVTVLLSALHDYRHVDWFLADCVCTQSQLKYLVTVKLPLIRTFNKVSVLQNLIGHLATSERRKPMFLDLIKEILSVWGDKTLMKHQSEQQQKYLTSALMIAAGHLKVTGCDKSVADGIMSKLLHGVQNHIASPESWIRVYGMVVAEQLTAVIQPEGPELTFEYELDDDVKFLVSLTDVTPKTQEPVEAGVDEMAVVAKEEKAETESSGRVQDEELDSDDDLEPFDMSHDVPTGAKKPMYLRDCMAGLLDQENREWMESCLQNVRGLIERCTDELPDVAEELSKILLYLDDRYCTPGFVAIRQQALISLAVNSPKIVATYLTEQFYEINLSIRQRLDILEVLALSSNQLATPTEQVSAPAVEKSVSNIADAHWKSVVAERVKAKTRTISKGRKAPPTAAKNRFSEVAGCFFYPLMSYYDRKGHTIDLLGEDSFVLARLICTLGIVQDSAANCPRSPHMALCLLEFVSALKYHAEACVREAILFALSVIFVNVPMSLLLSTGEQELVEIREWLQFVMEKDSFDTCRLKAAQVLQLLVSQVNKTMPVSDK